ncbi:MAG: vWA domain-containing protein [Isosphaeraceae bacterium]
MVRARYPMLFWSLALATLLSTAVAQDKSEKPQPAPKAESKPARKKLKPKPKEKKQKKAADDSSAPPVVMSKAAALARRPRSIFLAPPGSTSRDGDRYSQQETDWSEIPPWRQASFFGIRARGQFFIYVVDQSGSMLNDDRLIRAKIELRRSVFALQPPQRFEVIFYNEEATPMPGGPMSRPADPLNKNQLNSWLRLIGADGETEPRAALKLAIALRPDAIFLLSDGEYPDGTVEAVARANRAKVPIHCVDLSGGEAGDHLRRIARDSGGQYASRPGSLQAAP